MEEINEKNQTSLENSIACEKLQDLNLTENKTEIAVVDFQELKKHLDAHFLNLKNLIKYTKEKDSNINKLNSELQMYRNGIESVLFKSIAMLIISFREECKKSIRDMQKYQKQVTDIDKFLKYLILDYEDMLSNIGLEYIDGEYRYHGKSIVIDNIECKVFDSIIEEPFVSEISTQEITSIEDFFKYLQSTESEIKTILKNNALLDQLIGKYIQQESAYENCVWNIILTPVLKKLIGYFEKTKVIVEDIRKTLTVDNCNQEYINILDCVSSDLEEILVQCCVSVAPVVDTKYDPKKHRIIKILPTEDEALNGQISNIYSDCYTMDDKVIYPAKIDVLKK